MNRSAHSREKGEHMALIECPECGAAVSDAARRCPQCGYPIRKIGSSELRVAKEGATEAVNLIQKKINSVNDAAEKKMEEFAAKDVAGRAKTSLAGHKKPLIALLCFVVLLSGWFIYDQHRGIIDLSGSESESTTDSYDDYEVNVGLTEAEAKYLAEAAVRNEIDELQEGYTSFNSNIDSSKTRIEVGSIEKDGLYYFVYGRGDFINKFGNPDTKYNTSGSYSFEFTVKLSESGEVKSVEID